MTTATAIIRAALGKLGIVGPGEPLKPGDASSCLTSLNTMLDAWRLERLYAYATLTTDYTATGDVQSLTIGPAGDIVLPSRPERFEQGCFISQGGTDFPLEQINDADYNAIAFKPISGPGPTWFTYNPTLPEATLQFYPGLLQGSTIHLVTQIQLSEFADLSTSYILPAGYERALLFSLAEEVAADFEREIPPTVARNASSARRILKRGNNVVPQLSIGSPTLSPLARLYAG